MAQIVGGGINIPLEIEASLWPYSKVVLVEGWLVCHEAPEFVVDTSEEDDEGNPRFYSNFPLEFAPTTKNQVLEGFVRLMPKATDEQIRQWIARNGAFKPLGDAYQVKRLLSKDCLLPDSVKEEIKQAKLKPDQRVCVLQPDDVRREAVLLGKLAEITGALASGEKPLLLVTLIKEADSLLKGLYCSVPFVEEDWSHLDEIWLGDDNPQTEPPGKSQPTSKKTRPISADFLLTSLVERANGRAFGEDLRRFHEDPQTRFVYGSGRGARFSLRVHTVLACLYSILLASLDTRWQRCKRRDCGNLFISGGRGKEFCSHRCAHIEGQRRRREAAKQNKAKRRKRG